jgi:hypothetical protein
MTEQEKKELARLINLAKLELTYTNEGKTETPQFIDFSSNGELKGFSDYIYNGISTTFFIENGVVKKKESLVY